MYAIIRTGGKQAKVKAGDVLDVERLRADGDQVTFEPLLVVEDDGTVHSGREELAEAQVTATVLGGSLGPKVDVFKYRAKTGYRRRQGHRQKYTQIRVETIELKKGAAKAEAKPKAKAEAKPAKAEAKPEAKAEAKPAKAEAKPEAKAEAKPEAKPAKAAGKPKAASDEAAEPKSADAADDAAADDDESAPAKEA